ncbi:phosphatase and actin regulator 2 [Trichonephila clavipes]|nr:phosphatase and actin regulator 2 [Trichonephila clavipes]
MYKNALKEDPIKVVEDLDGTVESTDTIAKLKTKIENSSTVESDPDFVKTLIKNCIDERVSRNEREATLEKQKIELAKLQLAQLEKEVELQTAKNEALSLNPAAKVEEKQFETNIENIIKSAYAYPSAVSFSNMIENSSYDLSHVKNFNTRNDLSSLIKDYKCNKIKSTKLKLSIIREKCSDIVLCKKVNGAMKTSSVNFNTPSPMESKHRRFALLRKIFQPWQWKRRKKRNRFEQTSRTLQRKISMRSTKDQLVKKDVLMPGKHNVFSSGLDEKGKKGRTAADSVQSGWPIVAAKANSMLESSLDEGVWNFDQGCLVVIGREKLRY